MKEQFVMFAQYNHWANTRIYQAAETLGGGLYFANHGAYFGSVHGTLNHLLVGDTIWMNRFTKSDAPPIHLDQQLGATLEELRDERQVMDAKITAFAEGLTVADLAGEIAYRTITKPIDIRQKLAPALSHFFNHQTHHRGQVHCMLTQITGDAPSLDLITFQRETDATS